MPSAIYGCAEGRAALGRELILLNASTESEIDTAFATLVRERADALIVTSDPFFSSQRNQLVALAAPCDAHDLQ